MPLLCMRRGHVLASFIVRTPFTIVIVMAIHVRGVILDCERCRRTHTHKSKHHNSIAHMKAT